MISSMKLHTFSLDLDWFSRSQWQQKDETEIFILLTNSYPVFFKLVILVTCIYRYDPEDNASSNCEHGFPMDVWGALIDIILKIMLQLQVIMIMAFRFSHGCLRCSNTNRHNPEDNASSNHEYGFLGFPWMFDTLRCPNRYNPEDNALSNHEHGFPMDVWGALQIDNHHHHHHHLHQCAFLRELVEALPASPTI